MRGTEPRNHIRNRILLYRLKRLGVDGQNGHFQKFMIHMASFSSRNVPCQERYRTTKSHLESDTTVQSYKDWGQWTKWTFSKIHHSYGLLFM